VFDGIRSRKKTLSQFDSRVKAKMKLVIRIPKRLMIEMAWPENTWRSAAADIMSRVHAFRWIRFVQWFNEGLSPEAHRARQRRRFEAVRQAAAPLPEGLRDRLATARTHPRAGNSD
jgi:hypothetical protein